MRNLLSKRNTAGGQKTKNSSQPITDQCKIQISYNNDNALIFSAERELMKPDQKSNDQDSLNSGADNTSFDSTAKFERTRKQNLNTEVRIQDQSARDYTDSYHNKISIGTGQTSKESTTTKVGMMQQKISIRKFKSVKLDESVLQLPLREKHVVMALAKEASDRNTKDNHMLMEFFTYASCFQEIDIQRQDLIKVV